MSEQATLSKYDRLQGAMKDVATMTRPTTIKSVETLTGKAETYIVQTARYEDQGDYIFVEFIDESGQVTRLALPPRVSRAINSQRASLSKRRRSQSSKANMDKRIAEGFVPNFGRNKQTDDAA